MLKFLDFKRKIIEIGFFFKVSISKIVSYIIYSRIIFLSKPKTHTGIDPSSDKNIIVSLTTLPHRTKSSLITIYYLLFQEEIKPNKIILWITESENQTFKALNKRGRKLLEKLKQYGLEIHQTEDIGPFTKFLPTKEHYPNSIIVTSDDDIIYPRKWLKNLYESYLKSPEHIHCYRAHNMTFHDCGRPKKYNNWQFESIGIEGPSLELFPTGVCGVLYAPDHLDEQVLNKELYKRLSFKCDDVWLKAMSLKKGVLCKKVKKTPPYFFEINFNKKSPLNRTNVHESHNDICIDNVWKHYFNTK
jgi:hypothetical protein